MDFESELSEKEEAIEQLKCKLVDAVNERTESDMVSNQAELQIDLRIDALSQILNGLEDEAKAIRVELIGFETIMQDYERCILQQKDPNELKEMNGKLKKSNQTIRHLQNEQKVNLKKMSQLRVEMDAKNMELQCKDVRLGEMSIECGKLKEENSTMKRRKVKFKHMKRLTDKNNALNEVMHLVQNSGNRRIGESFL